MFTTKRKGIIALLCAVFAAALIACAISLAPSASRTAPVYAAEGDVAAIDGTNYTSLKEAINAASTAETTVTLLADVDEDITVAADDNITIDLNGNTLTNVSGHTITNNGTLTITDSSAEHDGKVDNITNARAAVYNEVGATANLIDGTFTRSAEVGTSVDESGGNSFYVIQNFGTMVIGSESSTPTVCFPEGKGHFSSMIENGWYDGTTNTTQVKANLTINSGNFSGGINTIKNDDWGIMTINGGTFVNVTQNVVQNNNVLTINGGTFNDDNAVTYVLSSRYFNVIEGMNQGITTITDGDFTGQLYVSGASADYEISGGTFSEVVDADYIVEGSVFYPAEDGTYKAVTEEEFETVTDNAGVALMNGVVYDSLADAVDAAPTDGTQVTITLIDTDGDGIVTGSGVKVVEGKNIVIDFDGLTYDVTNPTVGSPGTETNGFQLLKGSTVRMMNGTLVSDAALILIQNYCDLTVDDMTLDMSDCAQVQYVISNNFGNTVITGDTTIVAAPNQVAFDIYYWPGNGYTDGVSVTVDENFTGTVTGTVQYGTDSTGATEDNWQTNKANLAIENGTFDITFDVYSGEETEAAITISGGKFTTKFSDSYLADGYALSEYNGYYIPISSSTDGTLLEEIAQLRQEIDEAIAAINGELEGGDAATLADAVTALIGKMNELEDKIAELDENMVTDADLQAMKDTITTAYNAAVTRVKAELKAEINRLGEAIADLGDVKGQLDELKAAYEAADALLSAEIDGVSADLAELESAYQAADEALLKVITNLRTELSEDIYELRTAIEEMGDVNGQLDELKAAYEAADALLNADIDSVSAALAELESTYKAADDAIWNAIYALRDADSGMTTALWVIGVIAVLALCAGVAGVAFAIVRTKRS